MPCFASVLTVGLLTCRIDDPGVMTASGPALAQQQVVNENGLHLQYLCGNRFQARNSSRAAAQVTWRVQASTDTGRLTLPAPGEHEPYTFTFFRTNVSGTTQLYYEGRPVKSEANKGEACPADTVPAAAPDTIPKRLFDSLGIIREAAPPHRRYLKNVLAVEFEPHATQAQRQAIIDSIAGRVVGGRGAHRTGSSEGWYYVLIPGDGTTRPADRAAYFLNGMPLIGVAFPYSLDSGTPNSRRPRDAIGAVQFMARHPSTR